MIQHKGNVELKGLQPQAVWGLIVVYSVWEKLFPGRTLTITSVNDSTHGEGSLHGKGKAFDIRIKFLDMQEINGLHHSLIVALGKEWDVVLEDVEMENGHIHVEYDPD